MEKKKEQITEIFSSLFLDETPKPVLSNDRLLRGRTFTDTKIWVCRRISLLWRSIFTLYGWEMCSNEKYNLINEKAKTVILFQNSYYSSNSNARENVKHHLNRFKRQYPDWLVIIGAVNYSEDLRFENRGIRYLVGDCFLDFMLGEDRDWIERHLVGLFKDLPYLTNI